MRLTNRGRWGDEDERGTLNLITPRVRARAVAEARSGRVVALARPVTPTPYLVGPGALAHPGGQRAVQQALLYTGSPPIAAAELWTVTAHHPELTHLDALSHVVVDGMVYPGRPFTERVDAEGVHRGSTTAFTDGIVTRGVLLDLAPGGALPAGHGVGAADLDAAVARAGVTVEPGDGVVVRGGWDMATASGPIPGVTVEALAWLHEHDVAVWIGDIGDPVPRIEQDPPSPLHQIGVGQLGMPLTDVAAPGELAAVCAEENRWSFLLVLAPPRIHGASGVPVNPLAIF